jgi:predicted  nucleic acid-binding Zn-ribbon protein
MSEEKKSNGHDMAALMVEVLLRIEREQKETNKRLDIAVARIDALRTDVTTLFRQMGAVNESITGIRADVADLRADVKAIRHDLNDFKEETRGELTAIRRDLNDFKDETRRELTEIHGQLAKLTDQEARIFRLESAVFKAAGT